MSAIILLLIASLSVAAVFLGAFIWSVKHHQFDDGFSPPRRMLFDDHPSEVIPDRNIPDENKKRVHGN